jgi:hypothetical protein
MKIFSLKSFFFLSGGDRLKQVSVYDKMTKAEREVAEMLKNMGIRWTYEHPVFVWDENKRPRVWAPDFYLPQFGIYVEVCGSEEFDYEYRRKIFDKNGHKVIFLHLYKESEKWVFHLIKYLHLYSKKRHLVLNNLCLKAPLSRILNKTNFLKLIS